MKKTSKYDTRVHAIQKEFNLSDSEIDDMQNFLLRPELSKKDTTLKDVLEHIIRTDLLNDRQKVAFAYSIGMFKIERNAPTPMIITDDMFGFMQGG